MTVCAKESFSYDMPDGAQVVIHRGVPVPDDHPAVKGREHLFEPADTAAARTVGSGAAAAVETATAAPGERRSVARSKSAGSSRFAEEV